MPKKKLKDLIFCYEGKEPRTSSTGRIPVINISGEDGRKVERAIGDSPLIAIGSAGTIGKPRYFDRPVWITSTQIYLQVKDKKELDLRFLFAVLENLEWNNFKEPYTTRGALNRHKFFNHEIALLPLNEQRKIADQYFEYLAEIEREERILSGLKQFKNSCLEVMFPHIESKKKVTFDRL